MIVWREEKMEKVLTLLSTYNGEKYLKEQIESLLAQKGVEIEILIRDDGSKDSTIELLREYSKQNVLSWYSGNNLKSAKSFMNLVMHASGADYYAFCDQDDIWSDNKLNLAVEKLKDRNNSIPQLYASNYQLVDSQLYDLPDNGHVTTTSFGGALIASNCTGCTVVFNRKLLDVLQMHVPDTIIMHDDWAHKVCLAVGGEVTYDERKTLKYRQHENNVDGGIRTFKQRIRDVIRRYKGQDCIRSWQLKEILETYRFMMPNDNIRITEKICNYKVSINSRINVLCSKEINTPYVNLNRRFRLAILLGYY